MNPCHEFLLDKWKGEGAEIKITACHLTFADETFNISACQIKGDSVRICLGHVRSILGHVRSMSVQRQIKGDSIRTCQMAETNNSFQVTWRKVDSSNVHAFAVLTDNSHCGG